MKLRERTPATDHDFELIADLLRERGKVLVICISDAWGGLEQIAANDTLDLVDLRIPVTLVCLAGSPIHTAVKDIQGLKLIVLENRPRDAFDLQMRKLLRRAVLEDGHNLIHLHQPSLLASVVPWLWRAPRAVVIVSRHIMNAHNKKNFIHRALYSRVECIVAMSQALRRNILDTHPVREWQVKVIPYGLDFNILNPEKVRREKVRQEWGVDDNTLLVGVVGRLDPAKGQDTFLKAAAGLKLRIPQGTLVKFVIVGEETRGLGGRHLEYLKRLAADLHLEPDVIFAGYREDIAEVMSALDVFVMPSRQEAFGLVAIEAMAMKTPVVISRGGSADEMVGKEEYGLMIRPNDAFDLQTRLAELVISPETARAKGVKARDYVCAHFGRQERLRKTLELYERSLRKYKI